MSVERYITEIPLTFDVSNDCSVHWRIKYETYAANDADIPLHDLRSPIAMVSEWTTILSQIPNSAQISFGFAPLKFPSHDRKTSTLTMQLDIPSPDNTQLLNVKYILKNPPIPWHSFNKKSWKYKLISKALNPT